LILLFGSSLFGRSQLLGEANDLRSSKNRAARSGTGSDDVGSGPSDENSLSKKRMREDNSRDRTKRSRRDLETAIKRCLVAGLYMNAARYSSSLALHFTPVRVTGDVPMKLLIAQCLSSLAKIVVSQMIGNSRRC
jgi:hypothetical protein